MSEDLNEGFDSISFPKSSKFLSTTIFATIGNNSWDFRVYPITDNDEKEKYLGVSLRCNEDSYADLWSCNASVRFTLKKCETDDKDEEFSIDYKKKFTRADNEIKVAKFKKWEDLGSNVEVEYKITVNSSYGFKKHVLQTFDEPKENLTDVVLLVEGKKVHVGKQILALHSRYFEALFFSDFKESTEKEITIEDVVHSDFIDLLNLIYPSTKQIDWEEVEHILKLADRFEMWTVIDKIESFLINEEFYNHCEDIVEKLIYAEKYKMAALQDSCCDSLKSIKEVFNLTKEERYHELGADTHGLLFRRLVEIQKDCADNDD